MHREKFVGDEEEAYETTDNQILDDPEDNAYSELGPGKIGRLFQSGLATMIITCQQRGQMVHNFIHRLQNILTDIDTLNDGTISANELSETLLILKLGINQMQLDATIVCLDPEDTGRIDYEDFINNLRSVAALQARSRGEFSQLLHEASDITVENLKSGKKISPIRAGRKTGKNVRSVDASRGTKMKTSSIPSVANALGVEESSAGLGLQSILGYTGGGLVSSSRNVLWHPDSGMFGFVTGQAIIIEDLKGKSDSNNREESNASVEEEMLGSEQKFYLAQKRNQSNAVSHDGRYVAGAVLPRRNGYIYVGAHRNLLHSFRHEQGTIQVLQFDHQVNA